MADFFAQVQSVLGPFLPLIRIALVIVGAWAVNWVVKQLIHRFVEQIVSGVKKKRGVDSTQLLALVSPLNSVRTVQRARTIGDVLTNVATATIVIIAIIWCISIINSGLLASLTLLSAALGAGLGFGAQRIVGDVLNGIFMVIEDQLGVGDEVDVEFASGIVESVGVRVTQVRDLHGMLWFVRNGEIQRVGSNSQGWNRAVIDLAVPYTEDRERSEKVLLKASMEVYNDPDWIERFIEAPTVWGLETLSAEAVVIRLVAKTSPGSRWDVERELRARIQDAFKKEGIELPPLNSIVFDGPNGTRSDGRSNSFTQQGPAADPNQPGSTRIDGPRFPKPEDDKSDDDKA